MEEQRKFERNHSANSISRSNENIDPLLIRKLPKFFRLMNFNVDRIRPKQNLKVNIRPNLEFRTKSDCKNNSTRNTLKQY